MVAEEQYTYSNCKGHLPLDEEEVKCSNPFTIESLTNYEMIPTLNNSTLLTIIYSLKNQTKRIYENDSLVLYIYLIEFINKDSIT